MEATTQKLITIKSMEPLILDDSESFDLFLKRLKDVEENWRGKKERY